MVKNLGLGTGRRKTAVARVYLREGTGKIMVNGVDVHAYFKLEEHVIALRQPLVVTTNESKYDVVINVVGGGLNGQAGAIRHGIARALLQHNGGLRTSLKKAGLLTRDPRMVERKKYGRRKARARFQFSKR